MKEYKSKMSQEMKAILTILGVVFAVGVVVGMIFGLVLFSVVEI